MELNTERAQFIDALYRAMYERMYTYAAHRLTYSSSLAEEAVQEAFRVACTRIDAVMACDNPQGWMLTTLTPRPSSKACLPMRTSFCSNVWPAASARCWKRRRSWAYRSAPAAL